MDVVRLMICASPSSLTEGLRTVICPDGEIIDLEIVRLGG